MSEEQLQAEVKYRFSLSILKQMLGAGILTKGEFTKIDTKLHKLYRPILSSLSL